MPVIYSLHNNTFMQSIKTRLKKRRYRIGSEIGAGTQGHVYSGVDRSTGRTIAVKEFSSAYSCFASATIQQQWIEKEISALQALSRSQYSVHYLDTIRTSNKTLVITEFVKGDELHDFIMQYGEVGIPIGVAKQIFRQILLGVQEIHQAGFVHLDLKLENIMYDEKNNKVTIIDFGFAEPCRDSPTSPEKLLEKFCGSVHYTAPEIGVHQPYHGTKADIWALGVLLYTLLAKQFPFDCESGDQGAVLLAIQRGRFSAPNWFPLDLVDMLGLIFRRNPASRPSILELLNHPFLRS